MGGIQDFDQFDSLGLAELVRQGQVKNRFQHELTHSHPGTSGMCPRR